MYELPVLITSSIYDTIEEKYKNADIKVQLNRLIYAGDHFISKDDLISGLRESVSLANAGDYNGELTGFLLIYEKYFVHLLEGSEDTINRHLRILLAQKQKYKESVLQAISDAAGEDEAVNSDMFKRLKVLIVYHSINERLFRKWEYLSASPPTIVGKLDKFLPIADHMEHLRTCLDKIAYLCTLINEDEQFSFDGMSLTDKRMEALPEYLFLDYLLDSPHVLDLETYTRWYRTVDDYTYFFERVWPVPGAFTPRDLYKLTIDSVFVDPLPLQSWQQSEEEKALEEEAGSDKDEEDVFDI